MAWQSRSAISGLLKLGRQSSFNSVNYDNVCRLSLSSQVLVKSTTNYNNNNNFNLNFQQVRHNSTNSVRLSAYNELFGNDSVLPTQFGTLFSDTGPILYAQDALCYLHDVAGLSWVNTIILTTVGIRLLVGLPIAVTQQKAVAKMEQLTPELRKVAEHYQREVSIEKKIYGLSDREAARKAIRLIKRKMKQIQIENNCTPMRILSLGLLQVPFWITFSGAIRNLVYQLPVTTDAALADQQYRFVQMMMENTVIFESLVTPDVFALPGIFILTGLINIEINNVRNLLPDGTAQARGVFQRAIPWVLRTVTVGLGVFAMYVPSAVTLYWATSSTCALGVNVLLKIPAVRSLFRIPKTQSIEGAHSTKKNILSRLFRRKVPNSPAT